MTDHTVAHFQFRERRPGIACPVCDFRPFVGMQWLCAPDGCGGAFDTFETRARCPHCQAHFAWTACPACGKISAHGAWYRQPPEVRARE